MLEEKVEDPPMRHYSDTHCANLGAISHLGKLTVEMRHHEDNCSIILAVDLRRKYLIIISSAIYVSNSFRQYYGTLNIILY